MESPAASPTPPPVHEGPGAQAQAQAEIPDSERRRLLQNARRKRRKKEITFIKLAHELVIHDDCDVYCHIRHRNNNEHFVYNSDPDRAANPTQTWPMSYEAVGRFYPPMPEINTPRAPKYLLRKALEKLAQSKAAAEAKAAAKAATAQNNQTGTGTAVEPIRTSAPQAMSPEAMSPQAMSPEAVAPEAMGVFEAVAVQSTQSAGTDTMGPSWVDAPEAVAPQTMTPEAMNSFEAMGAFEAMDAFEMTDDSADSVMLLSPESYEVLSADPPARASGIALMEAPVAMDAPDASALLPSPEFHESPAGPSAYPPAAAPSAQVDIDDIDDIDDPAPPATGKHKPLDFYILIPTIASRKDGRSDSTAMRPGTLSRDAPVTPPSQGLVTPCSPPAAPRRQRPLRSSERGTPVPPGLVTQGRRRVRRRALGNSK